jgi:cytochrome c peroxidase
VDSENYKSLNQPNILKIEEEDLTDIKIKEPYGFQVLEESIYEEVPNLESIKKNARLISKRILLISNSTQLDYIKDYHVIWMIRDQVVRIALTGITGFDSPVLERSLEEAQIGYKSILQLLESNEHRFKNKELFQQWLTEIKNVNSYLNTDFNSFNRFEFIKRFTHKQLELINNTAQDWNTEFPFTKALNNDIKSLFSNDAFNQDFFAPDPLAENQTDRIELGEQLFFDSALSNSKTINCATCHDPNKSYTDGLKISKGVTRNSPTLLYVGLQKGFFYDNRAGSLEGQIVSVVTNENEFHSDLKNLESTIKASENYKNKFESIYKEGATDMNIRNAIASYLRSLSFFNSKFDNNINGKEASLTEPEINGFNLFMGKAKCATCHFAPVFNGTVPVAFKESEMELIGVPKTTDTLNVFIDVDLGRYDLYQTEVRKHFFKTPTVRNVANTGPYMHNGVYKSLREVVDFYNKGGGVGLGLDLPYQTLPSDNLNLSDKEINDLIAFMETLNDDLPETTY